MISPLVTGFATSFSLILAIGAQNALVLRQGLAKSHVLACVAFCAISDAILIVLGILGFDKIVAAYPAFPKVMAIMGAIFLVWYGALRLVAAYRGNYEVELSGAALPLRRIIATLGVVTWLNPHVYLDTLGLIGAISTDYAITSEKISFGVGAVSASFVFFASLGYGARYLAPIMSEPYTWRVLDIVIALVMFIIAYQLMH